jgi:hypothetical protein
LSQLKEWFRDVFSTTSSSIILLTSSFIMRRCTLGTTFCPIPSGVWVTAETLILRFLWPRSSGPTGQQGYISVVVPDIDKPLGTASIVRDWLDDVMSCSCGWIVPGWLPMRVSCRLAELLIGPVGRQPRLAGLLSGQVGRQRRLAGLLGGLVGRQPTSLGCSFVWWASRLGGPSPGDLLGLPAELLGRQAIFERSWGPLCVPCS